MHKGFLFILIFLQKSPGPCFPPQLVIKCDRQSYTYAPGRGATSGSRSAREYLSALKSANALGQYSKIQ